MPAPDSQYLPLLQERRIAAVATIGRDGMPHLTSVWFLYEAPWLYLAIPSSSAKGRNLARNSSIAVMIDRRTAGQELGITAIGRAEILHRDEALPITRQLHEKYLTPAGVADPAVGPVFEAVDDIAVRVHPERWISWDMSALDQQVFGGAIAAQGYLRNIAP